MNADDLNNELVILMEILNYRPKFGSPILIPHTKVDLWKTRMVSETFTLRDHHKGSNNHGSELNEEYTKWSRISHHCFTGQNKPDSTGK